MRKCAFCICKNKVADQLSGNCTEDHRAFVLLHNMRVTHLVTKLMFNEALIYIMPLLPKSVISPSSVSVQPCLCRLWSLNPKKGFLAMQVIF